MSRVPGLQARFACLGAILMLSITGSHSGFGQQASGRPPRTPSPVIVIDPGHPSEVSDGASVHYGVTEVHVAWEVSTRTRDLLAARGITVVLTKTRERELVRNRRRAEIANAVGARLMVRLHCDASAGSGFALYHPDRPGFAQGTKGPSEAVIAGSARAARILHRRMSTRLAGYLVDGGVRGDSQTLIGSRQGALTGSIFSRVPVVTIEMVVLTHPVDASKIRSREGQERMAGAIADGIEDYLR